MSARALTMSPTKFFSSIVAITLVLDSSVGFRVKPKHKEGGRPGEVAATYPFASPGVAAPALKNPRRADGCFPGMRFWTVRKQWFGTETDLPTTITGPWPMSFRHSKMDVAEIQLKRNRISRRWGCTDETPKLPRGLPKVIHKIDMYTKLARTIDQRLFNISLFALPQSMVYSRAEVNESLRHSGWYLAGSATDGGGSGLYIGRKVSHLIQQESSRECILTFQGTASFQDWVANLNIGKSDFCGVSSRVHTGFRDTLRAMMRNKLWQNNVRAKLPTCSKVYVTGHSLGGALAQLFSACIAQAPKAGTKGYNEDYKYMSWTTD